jgi:TRAP-type mannitol/chloroaromatic compound transport system permease small subunit
VENYTRFFAWIGAWGFTLLMMAMVFEVISRYFLGAPTKWAFEVAYMLMGTSFMFGIAYCMQMRRHVRVDFFYDSVGLKTRSIIDLFGFLILLPMILWLCAGLWDYFHQAYRVNELSGESAWNPIIWPFKFTFVMGLILLLMQTVVEVIKCILVLLENKESEIDAKERLT